MKALLLALNASYVHTSLSARYLRAACKGAGVELDVVESNINERAEVIAARVAQAKPDVLLCSVYIWNRRLMEDICTRIRLMYPQTLMVWGGPEVTSCHPGHCGKSVDYVLWGEGEEAVPVLLKQLAKGQLPVLPQTMTKVATLDHLPYPYDGEEFVGNKLYYFETSRGCPYHCAYCLSSAEEGVRYMSLPLAKAYLARLATKAPIIKFVDRTFNSDPTRARELWKFLMEQPGDCRYHFEICAHLLRDEDFELLAHPEARRFQFEVGLQSTSPMALAAINRFMDTEKLLKNVERLVALSTVEVHLDLIAGLPGESLASFLTSVNVALAARPHRLHLGFLKLLPGTPLRKRAEQEGYAFLPFAPYEVLRAPLMTPEDLLYLKSIDKTIDRFYNSRLAEQALCYALTCLQPMQVFDVLAKEEGRCIQEALFLALQPYVPDAALLRELCLYDYLKSEPHRRAPEVLLSGPDEEQQALRALVYGDTERLFCVLPHQKGEKPGSILRSLRWARFAEATLSRLGFSAGTALFFDHATHNDVKVLSDKSKLC